MTHQSGLKHADVLHMDEVRVFAAMLVVLLAACGGVSQAAVDQAVEDALARAATSHPTTTSLPAATLPPSLMGWSVDEWERLRIFVSSDPYPTACESWNLLTLEEATDAALLGWNLAAEQPGGPPRMSLETGLMYVGLQVTYHCHEYFEAFKVELKATYGDRMAGAIENTWVTLWGYADEG